MIGLLFDLITYLRLARIASRRDPEGCQEKFRERFPDQDAKNLQGPIQTIQSMILFRRFPVLPTDRLSDDLEIDQGTLEETLGLPFKKQKFPETCEDLVVLLLQTTADAEKKETND